MDFKDYYEILGVAPDAEKYDELLAQYQQWQQTGGRQQDFDWQD